MRRTIRFLRKGKVVELANVPPTQTLLDYLRLGEHATGTKEGCNEGDCGACTVAVGQLKDGKVCYSPVNACIRFTGQLDGCEIVTVEDLGRPGNLHPLQQAMVECHGSQCGFCTPGIVMSLFTLYQGAETPATCTDVVEQLQGNLCRCTGYRAIVDAAKRAITGPASDAFAVANPATAASLAAINDGQDIFVPHGDGFFAAPASEAAVAALCAQHPDAVIVAGSTDVGLWVNKQLRTLPKIISIGRAADMKAIDDTPDQLVIGAGATYAEAEAAFGALDADVASVLKRIGSQQVRASGTIGGNVANGSPIGDTPPMLIALGASVTLRHGNSFRTVPLEQFFIAYGKQDRKPGEIVSSITVPKLKHGQHFRAFKNSKRFDQDISAVMGAFCLDVTAGHITSARMAFGGMAGTPKRASAAEAALKGVSLADEAAWETALNALEADYQPLTDMRASAAYRRKAARAMLLKTLLELAGTGTAQTRVTAQREEVA